MTPTRFLAGCAALAALATGAHAACPSDADVAALFDAYNTRTPARDIEGLSPADGECARGKFNLLLERKLGKPVGYKAGLTNPAVQKRFNHDQPVWGTLYAPMLLNNGAVVEAAFGARSLYEADMLVRVSSTTINQAQTPEQVLQAIDQVIPAIELPDLMVQAPPKLNGAGVTAINVGARFFVLGAPLPVPTARAEQLQLLDGLRDMVAVVQVGTPGTMGEIDRGKGSDVLGHPLAAVAWLAKDMARDGKALKVGDLVSLGSFSKLLPPKAGQSVQVDYYGLPGTPQVIVSFK